MTHVGYLIAAYLITFGAIGAYAGWVVARSRALARTLEGAGPSGPFRAGAWARAIPGPIADPLKTRTGRLWLAGGVVVVALGFLLFRGLGDATVYFRTADEAAAQRESLGDRRFRIEGTVIPGSVRSAENDVAFRIAGQEVEVPVLHQGDPPELFRPGIPVVLEGHFAGEHFASDRIMVKHSESYVAEHPERVTTVPSVGP